MDCPPLDVAAPRLTERLQKTRDAAARKLQKCLAHYDRATGASDEDYKLGPRIGYEQAVRMESLREIRATMADDVPAVKEEFGEHESDRQIVIVVLVAVHIVEKARLDRLGHVIRSIARQEAPPDGAELVVAFSWYASTPALAAETESALASLQDLGSKRDRATTEGPDRVVVVQQHDRRTQFQHLHAALDEAEAALRAGWSSGPGDEQKRSVWAMFGDDDDLWHSRRVAEAVRAIAAHQLLPGVGVFATMTRANIRGSDVLAASPMPTSEEEVDAYLGDGRAVPNTETEFNKEWREKIRGAGGQAWTLQVPFVDLEYFDFCPRLRLVREFFRTTSAYVLGHRLCDLRFRDYLLYYPLMGAELGLEVAYFEPACWMYFYANAMPNQEEWKQAIIGQGEGAAQEGPGDGAGEHVGLVDGHISSEVRVEAAERAWAEKYVDEFSSVDPEMSAGELLRCLAHFRNRMENFLVRCHTWTLDQRDFDSMIFQAIQCSFVGFVDRVRASDQEAADQACTFLCHVCRNYAIEEMLGHVDVRVGWFDPDLFIPNAG